MENKRSSVNKVLQYLGKDQEASKTEADKKAVEYQYKPLDYNRIFNTPIRRLCSAEKLSEGLAASESRIKHLQQLPLEPLDARKAAKKLKKQKKKEMKKEALRKSFSGNQSTTFIKPNSPEKLEFGGKRSYKADLGTLHGSNNPSEAAKLANRIVKHPQTEKQNENDNQFQQRGYHRLGQSGSKPGESPQNGRASNSRKASHHSTIRDEDSGEKERKYTYENMHRKLDNGNLRRDNRDARAVRITEESSVSDRNGRYSVNLAPGSQPDSSRFSNSKNLRDLGGASRLFADAQESFECNKFVKELQSVEKVGSSSHANHSARYLPIDGQRILLADEDRIRERLNSYVNKSEESAVVTESEEDGDYVGGI
jgi:hypothetical protein